MPKFRIPSYNPLDVTNRKLMYLFMLYFNIWTFSIKLDNNVITLVPGGLDNPLIPVLNSRAPIYNLICRLRSNLEDKEIIIGIDPIVLSLLAQNERFSKEIKKASEKCSKPCTKSLYEFYMKFRPEAMYYEGRCYQDIFRELNTEVEAIYPNIAIYNTTTVREYETYVFRSNDFIKRLNDSAIEKIKSDIVYERTIISDDVYGVNKEEAKVKQYVDLLQQQLMYCVLRYDALNKFTNKSFIQLDESEKEKIEEISTSITNTVFSQVKEHCPIRPEYIPNLYSEGSLEGFVELNKQIVLAIHEEFKNSWISNEVKEIIAQSLELKPLIEDHTWNDYG